MQVEEILMHVDSMVKLLIEGLQARSLLACVNLLLVADHGMAKAGPDRIIRLDKYIPDLLNTTTRVWDGTFIRFEPKDESTSASQNILYITVFIIIYLWDITFNICKTKDGKEMNWYVLLTTDFSGAKYQMMEALSCKQPEMRVYKRELLPIRQVCFILLRMYLCISMLIYRIFYTG